MDSTAFSLSPAVNSPPTPLSGGDDDSMNDIETPPLLHSNTMIFDDAPVRGKRKARSSLSETEVKELVNKLQKLSHETPKVDYARCVNVKFGNGIVLKAKKLYQEPWGTMVCALEAYEPLDIKMGSRFWAKWDGTVCQYTKLPLLHAMHSVDGGLTR